MLYNVHTSESHNHQKNIQGFEIYIEVIILLTKGKKKTPVVGTFRKL